MDEGGTESSQKEDEIERKARVDAVWQKMNKGVSSDTLKSIVRKQSSIVKKSPQKKPAQSASTGWMTYLGLASNKNVSPKQKVLEKCETSTNQNCKNEDAKKLAAAALLAVQDAALPSNLGRGKVEITEVKDFAGEKVEVKKLVDATSKEATEKGSNTSAVDAILEQIKKKQKLSVLDKTKKDWGEFKDENKGLEDELETYKKSSNKYLDKVSFLQRTDYREFERERDARLLVQAKRKTADMRED